MAKLAEERNKPNKPLVLVDGSSYLFRAFYAMPHLTNAKGEPTGAIYGVLNMLKRLKVDLHPEHIVIVFDAKGKNFRHELYPAYKANRLAMPEALAAQIQPLHEMIRHMGFPLLMQSGVEADDVIGTLAVKAADHGKEVLIITADKDFAQLLTHAHIRIFDSMKNVPIDDAHLMTKWGIHTHQVLDFLALTGDTSDNIPGVPQVGPKTAAKWLSQYGSLNEIIEHAAEIGGKVGESLRANLKQLDLARELLTIHCEVDLPFSLEDFSMKPIDPAAIRPYFERFGFTSWLNQLEMPALDKSMNIASPLEGEAEKPQVSRVRGDQFECILTPEQWTDWQKKLNAAKVIAFDSETTSLNPMNAELVGVSFALNDEAMYLPLQHQYLGVPEQLPFEKTLNELKLILENPAIQKVMQNGKYDSKVLLRYGIQVQGFYFDTMLASYVLNSSSNRHDLASISKRELDIDGIKFEDVAGKGAKQKLFSEVELAPATEYAAEDAHLTLLLYRHFSSQLAREPKLKAVFEDMEMPLSRVLTKMEYRGVLIDANVLLTQSQHLKTRLYELEREAFRLAGVEFNLASPKQLLHVLYEKMQLPILQKTPTGQPSTSEDVLQELAVSFELPRIILEHRHLAKLKSTYTDKLPELINPQTHRVHTQYQQAVAVTGRLSSTDPNLQNIPMKSEVGRKIREAFIAPSGYQILSADYSQIELRIMAHLSEDKGLLAAFARGDDIHRATAAEIFDIKQAEVSTEQRRRAKAVNFGLIYGMSSFGLAKQIGVGRKEAQLYVDRYFERYPGVKNYMERTRELARSQGYVETLLGRRLYLPEINSKNALQRKAAERAAINAPMQGSAADIIKRAMITIDNDLMQYHDAHMIMQVHDELVFEVKHEAVESFKDFVCKAMMGALQLRVPLEVNMGVGDNWGAAH